MCTLNFITFLYSFNYSTLRLQYNVSMYQVSSDQPVKYVMLVYVFDSVSNLREYFQYFFLSHWFITRCQVLSQCPFDK